jgi:DNA-binding CsgD family transcriptional regulator
VTQKKFDNLSPSNRIKKDMDTRAISRLSDLHFPPKLTKRESEILPLLLAGSTRDEIASSLSVSPETVKLHTRNILSKFGATTVRDGFYDMNLYQTHYGVGGQGSDRFENLFQCVCQILPGRRDVRITNKLNIAVMQDELSEFKFSYVANGSLVDAIAPGNMLDGPDDADHAQTFRIIPGTTLNMFDPYEFSFGVTFKDEFQDNTGLIVEQATYPALRREYIFEFDPADVPDRIQYDALSGTHIIDNYPLDVDTNGNRLSIIDTSPRVPMSLRVKWGWNED